MLARSPTPRSRASTSTLALEAATALLEPTTTSLSTLRRTATAATALELAARGERRVGTHAALLDVQTLAVDGVRVRGDSGVVALGSLPIDECAVLYQKCQNLCSLGLFMSA